MAIRGYLRVSTLDQATTGTSLDGQRDEIVRYAAGEDVVWYRDAESGSGAGEDRLEQRRLLSDLLPGDVVVVAKQDRWSRDTLFFLSSTKAIVARGARFLALAERFDSSTPEGRFTSTIMAAVAEQERARILDRTQGARIRLRANGQWVNGGAAPLGYRVVDRKPVIDEATAPIVRRMFELAVGLSAGAVGERLALEFPGTVGLDRGAVARRLRDRRYLGESPTEQTPGPKHKRRRWGGWTRTHEPIVTEEAFYAVAERLTSRLRIGRTPSSPVSGRFLLRSLVRCDVCDHVVDCHGAATEGPRTHDYYSCHRCSVRARRDASDAKIEIEVPTHLALLSKRLAKASPVRQEAAPDFAAARARLLAKRGRLVAAVADGAMPLDQVRPLRETIDADLAKVDREAAAYAARPRAVSRAECLAKVDEITARWEVAGLAERREIVRILTERITLRRKAEAKKWERGSTEVFAVWKKCGLWDHILTAHVTSPTSYSAETLGIEVPRERASVPSGPRRSHARETSAGRLAGRRNKRGPRRAPDCR